jgi:hypothetical protein
MKIALCLSGQPRFVPEVAPYITKNILNGYDVDTFFHFWFDEDLQSKPYKYGGSGGWENQRISSTAIEDALQIYKPKLYKVEKSKVFLDSNLYTELCFRDNGQPINWTRHWRESMEPNYRDRQVNNCLSCHYSLNQVNLLKKEYEYSNNFKYDFVVRCRTDTVIHTKILFENYDKNTIHYSGMQNQPDNMILDWINFGSSKHMDAFMSTFSMSDLFLEKCMMNNNGAWCNEMLHKTVLDHFNIPYQAHPLHVELPRF